MLREFMAVIDIAAQKLTANSGERLKRDARVDFIQHYEHADITPTQAQELGSIYKSLFHFTSMYLKSSKVPSEAIFDREYLEQEYLRLNKEFLKYTGK